MIETKVALNFDGVLELGYPAENDARCFVFDLSDWLDSFEAGGSVALLARRQWDSDYYPCVIEVDGSAATWTVKLADVAQPGEGRIVLQYKAGETVVRSQPFLTHVARGIGGDLSEIPPAHEPWVQQVLEAGENAEAAAERAEAAAVGGKSIFTARYNETTWEELCAKCEAGKIPFCYFERPEDAEGEYHYVPLYKKTDNVATFRQIGATQILTVHLYKPGVHSGWWDYEFTPVNDHTHTVEDVTGAMPGYKEMVSGGENLNDYTTPGNYLISGAQNKTVVNAAFDGEVGTFLEVIPFNDKNGRLKQIATTNRKGNIQSRYRVLTSSGWSAWKGEEEHTHAIADVDGLEAYLKSYVDEAILGGEW